MSETTLAAEPDTLTAPAADSITPLTIARFMVGDREAIELIARSRNAIWLGMVFVLSAGFAREYDGESLLHEPWHVLLPLAASIATSLILFVMISFAGMMRGREIRILSLYPRFLGLFWMTAPLAWLYAIPVERFMTAGSATEINLMFLTIVALWRVVLMVRIVISAFGAKTDVTAAMIVLFFADMVLLTAMWLIPKPVIAIMGGVRLTESQITIANFTFITSALGVLTLPLWFFGYLWACRNKPVWEVAPIDETRPIRINGSTWGFAAMSLLIWIPILPFTQHEQYLRYEAERDLKSGRAMKAIQLLCKYEQEDFPPHWDPPPRIGYGDREPDLYAVLETMHKQKPLKPWVRELYLQKFSDQLYQDLMRTRFVSDFERLERAVEFAESSPEAARKFLELEPSPVELLEYNNDYPPNLRRRIRALAGLPEEPMIEEEVVEPGNEIE